MGQAVYQSLLQLSWIDKLIDNVRTLFTTLYRDEFKKPHTSVIICPFDDYFDRQFQELEKSAEGITSQPSASIPTTNVTSLLEDDTDAPPMPTLRKGEFRFSNRSSTLTLTAPQRLLSGDILSADYSPTQTPDTSRPASPGSHLHTAKMGPGGRTSRRARKGAPNPPSREDSFSAKSKQDGKSTGKKARKWDHHGLMDESDDRVLDYSAAANTDSEAEGTGPAPEAIARDSWGVQTRQGEFVLKDLDEEMDNILAAAKAKKTASSASTNGGLVGTGLGALSGLFHNVVGGKTLTKEDLAKPMKGMEDHLINRNVAHEAAVRLCDAVERDLIGTKTASFQSIDTTIHAAMERALSKILTPTNSLDLLRSIQAVTSQPLISPITGARRRPYVMSVVGVNGVGKSTTLSKIAFLLLHNNLRVLVCAADTFRSGAVEQLRVHVRNLRELTAREGLGHIDLFERGYGKDAALIARDAVAYAESTGEFDVVLIDTAGRRHNDQRLMSSLEKFATMARPDKILMVGEALVGTDSVAQARHFNASFGPGRKLDGFIVSKCDTVGEMVGTLVSMVHATGVPVVALGVGQHYGDLRGLNVGWATRLLMQ